MSNTKAHLPNGDTVILLEKNLDESYTLNLGKSCSRTGHHHPALRTDPAFRTERMRLIIPTVSFFANGDPIQDGLQPHQVVEVQPGGRLPIRDSH